MIVFEYILLKIVKDFFSSSIVSKVTIQTFWQLLAKLISSFATLILLGIITRNFYESGTGIYTLSSTTISFIYLAIDFGINAHLVSEIIRNKNYGEWQEVLGSRVILVTLLLLIIDLMFLLIPGINELFRMSVLIGDISALGYSLFITSQVVFQVEGRFDLYFISSLVASLFTLALTIIIIYLTRFIPGLFIATAFSWGVAGLLSLILVKRYVKIKPLFNINFLKSLLLNVWPISTTMVLNTIYFRADSFILSFDKSFSVVGIYNLPYQLFQSAIVLPTFIMNSFYPHLAETFYIDKVKFERYLKRLVLIMIIISVSVMAFSYFLAAFIVHLISGRGFIPSPRILQILSFGFPAFFITSVFQWLLILLRRYKLMLLIYASGLFVNILLNVIFIPKYSYYASSWITVISEYLILFMQVLTLRIKNRLLIESVLSNFRIKMS